MPAPTQATLIKLLQESDGALMETEVIHDFVTEVYNVKMLLSADLLNDIDSLCDKAIAHLKAVKRITKSI